MRARKTDRRPRTDQDQRLELARAVAMGRATGTPWKALARVYGRSVRQLQRYAGSRPWRNGAYDAF